MTTFSEEVLSFRVDVGAGRATALQTLEDGSVHVLSTAPATLSSAAAPMFGTTQITTLDSLVGPAEEWSAARGGREGAREGGSQGGREGARGNERGSEGAEEGDPQLA